MGAASAKKEKEQRDLFDSHDRDGDQLLCLEEIIGFAAAEYALIDLREDFLEKIAQGLFSTGSMGVSYDKFGRLRQMLAIERSEVRARARRAEEEERRRREQEAEERRQHDMATRIKAATAMLEACTRRLPELELGLVRAEAAAGPLLAEEKLGSSELQAVATKTEAAVDEPAAVLRQVQEHLRSAEQALGTDLRQHRLALEVTHVRVLAGREAKRLERLRRASTDAKSKVVTKAQEESRAAQRRKAFARLERAYEELDEGESDQDGWSIQVDRGN